MRRLFALTLVATFAFPTAALAGRYASSTKIYVQQNNWKKALQSIEKWKEEDPKSPEPYLWEGYIYTRMEKYTDAAKAFMEAYKKDSTVFLDPKKFEKKLSITGQNLMNFDALSISLQNAIIQYYNEQNYDDALKVAEFLVKVNPNYAQAYQLLTTLYQIKAQQAENDSIALVYIDKARQALEKYYHMNPKDARANYFLGVFYYQEASELIAKGDTTNGNAKLRKAVELLKKAAELGYEDAYYDLGIALSDLGKNDEAIEYLKKAAEKNPKSFEVWFNLAVVAIKAGDKETALQALKKAREVKPDDYTTNYLLSVLLTEKGKFEEALQYANDALAIKETPEAYEQKAIILRELGKTSEALKALKKAESLKNNK